MGTHAMKINGVSGDIGHAAMSNKPDNMLKVNGFMRVFELERKDEIDFNGQCFYKHNRMSKEQTVQVSDTTMLIEGLMLATKKTEIKNRDQND
jgi:hypothetical protein